MSSNSSRFGLKLLVLSLTFFSANAHALFLAKNSPDDLGRLAESILVKVKIQSKLGEGNGTGFFVKANLILTNFHVIQESIFLNGKISLENNQFYITRVELINFDIEKDLALLEVPSFIKNSSLDILVHPREELNFDDYITSYGYPLGENDPLYTESSFGFEGFDYYHVTNTSTVLFNQLLPGMSGGPLFTESGTFAGMNSAVLFEENNYSCNEKPTTGLIVSAENVKSFLQESIQSPNMSLADEDVYKKGLNKGSFVSN